MIDVWVFLYIFIYIYTYKKNKVQSDLETMRPVMTII